MQARLGYIALFVNRFICFCLLSSLAATFSQAASTQMYHWKDADGRSHYSDRPPSDNDANIINMEFVNDQKKNAIAVEDKDLLGQASDESTKQQENKALELLPEKDQEKCSQARKAIAALERNQAIRMRDDSGKPYILDQKQRMDQLEIAKQAENAYCD